MKVLAVCGFGCGSSMILKMTLDKAIASLGVKCETEISDISTARGAPCDAIFTSMELADELKKFGNVPIYPIKKYMNLEEVTEAFQQFLNDQKET